MTHAALAAWRGHLQDLEITLESRLDWSRGGSSLYFRVSPNGHSLQVATSGP